jgi:vitamin-K-epoxide reductase (warfarin-sensitive)
MVWYIYGLLALGFLFSLYLYLVEKKLQTNPLYKPACDINDRLSCSAVAQSGYGDMFFVPFSLLGIFFYPLFALIVWLGFDWLFLIATGISVLLSFYLGYLQLFKIKAICVVCCTIYLINIALFLNALNIFLNF